MNLRRGLFRFWLLFAIAFVAGTAALSYATIKSEYQKWELIKFLDQKGDLTLIPMDCNVARGTDYRSFDNNCWYEMPKFRIAYPEYNDVADDQLMTKLYEKAGRPLHPATPLWMTLLQIAAFALGVPLGVLLVGSALFWAGAGFRGQA